ncbi:MAG: NAD-dependent epimerase/dehydratase family protein [Cytophagales bacterium]|nr:MAG: NAD-dependent epimerase/dehydratase family protein [Cytophagales bacterium]TAF59397.1 MAG: NAD-dependent epimerase/dehydratase family protein [Cytophagales bacterium]
MEINTEPQKTTAFVTGANGFVGSFIVKELLDKGLDVKILLRPQAETLLIDEVLHRLEVIEGDVLDVCVLQEAMQGVQVVVHAAAVVSMAAKRYANMMKVNVEGTANMVNMALLCGVKQFVHISSVAAIGNPSTATQAISEAEPLYNNVAGTMYAQSKYWSEREVWRAIEEGLPAVILNPAYVLGHGNWLKSSVQVFHYIWQKNSFFPPGSLNYVDVRDIAKATWQVIRQEKKAERFILCAGLKPHREVFAEIAKRFDVKPPSRRLSPILAKIACWFESIKCALTSAEPRITKDTIAAASNNVPYDGQKATRVLAIEYQTLQETLDWACKAYKAQQEKLGV